MFYVGVPLGVYNVIFGVRPFGDFAMLGPDREEKCGAQGVYGRSKLYFWADSIAMR